MNFDYSYWVFALGLGLSIAIGITYWVISGRRLNLYLVSGDSQVADQALIPVTAENARRSNHERIDLTLTDFQNRAYSFRVGYGTFMRFFLILGPGTVDSKLNRQMLESGKLYPIRSGMKLAVGDREYTLVASRANSQSELLRRFV